MWRLDERKNLHTTLIQERLPYDSVAIPNPGTPRRNEIHEILRNEVFDKRVNRRNQANLSVDEGFSVTNDLKSSNALHSYYCMGNESFFLVGFLSVCVYLLVRTHTHENDVLRRFELRCPHR